MANIFLSYSRADRARVAPLVGALEAQGWSVWWDPAIIPGQEFDDRIAEEIDKASAVVVVWTPASVASRWVRGEAREAADRGILVPVRFDNARLPIDARAVHTTDLDDWREDASSRSFQDLLSALSLLLKDIPRAASAAAHRASICVLPFANMSDAREQEYFSDGISEDIITDLSKVSALAVIARNTAFTFKGRSIDVPQVARQLKVSHVLEGSVRRSGNRVRITAQLIDGTSGNHVWAERYDRDLDDIFALQDEISKAIVAALKLKLLPEEKKAIEDRGTDNVEAYDLYLRARSLTATLSPEQLKRAADLCREALSRDPQFVLAWTALASTLHLGTLYMPKETTALQAEWDRVVERAVTLAPNLWASQFALGERESYRRHWIAAEEALNRAVQRVPRSAVEARSTLGRLLSSLGRMEEAIIQHRAACEADPLSMLASTNLQIGLTAAGRDEEAQKEYHRSQDLTGDRSGIEHHALLRAWARRDSPQILREHLRRLIADDSVPMPLQSDLLEVLDQPVAARTLLEQAFEDPDYQDATRQFRISMWAALFDDIDLALATARRAYVELHSFGVFLLWQPVYCAMRRDERFKQLLRDLGIVDYWRQTGRWGDYARPLDDDNFEIIR